MIWLIKKFRDTSSGRKILLPTTTTHFTATPPEMSSSANIRLKIEAAHAKREQERLAAEAEEAVMLKEMEEWLEEEKRMEEVRKAMEIEKRESEWNQRQIQKEKWRVEAAKELSGSEYGGEDEEEEEEEEDEEEEDEDDEGEEDEEV